MNFSFSSNFSSASSVVFLAAFSSYSVFTVLLAWFLSNFGVILNKSYIYRDPNFYWPTQCAGLSLSLKHFFKTHKMDFFFHHDSLDSPTKVYSSVSEISNHIILDLPQLFFSLFYPPLFALFCLFSFSLVVVASDLICPHTNHLQYHVIMICVFTLDWVD